MVVLCAQINNVIANLNSTGWYSMLFGGLTDKLVKEKSVRHLTTPSISSNVYTSSAGAPSTMIVDILKDVINLVPVYFASMEVAGLPMKTRDAPQGVYADTELAGMVRDVARLVAFHFADRLRRG